MRNRLPSILRLLWITLLALVVVGSLLPPSSTPVKLLDRLHADKLIHFCLYAALAFLPMLHENRHRAGIFFLTTVLLGFVLEGLQHFAGRTVEVADVLANEWGVVCGSLLGLWVRLESAGVRAFRIEE